MEYTVQIPPALDYVDIKSFDVDSMNDCSAQLYSKLQALYALSDLTCPEMTAGMTPTDLLRVIGEIQRHIIQEAERKINAAMGGEK